MENEKTKEELLKEYSNIFPKMTKEEKFEYLYNKYSDLLNDTLRNYDKEQMKEEIKRLKSFQGGK